MSTSTTEETLAVEGTMGSSQSSGHKGFCADANAAVIKMDRNLFTVLSYPYRPAQHLRGQSLLLVAVHHLCHPRLQ